jgi:predicted O-methyltransferase YrrM
VYRLGLRLGIHVLPAHYYLPVPDILELERTKSWWARRLSLTGIESDLGRQIEDLERIALPFQTEYNGNAAYRTGVREGFGPGFGYIEAQVLHAMVRSFKPARIVEIGSGVSTACARAAAALNEREGRPCEIVCIEPFPSRPLRRLAEIDPTVRLIARPVQQIAQDVFTRLDQGDILFVDSSHTVKAGSDVNHIVFEILPLLRPGVLVHFHDITLPYDYQRDLLSTFIHNNETSLVTAFLMFNQRFHILCCLAHLHYDRAADLKRLFPEYRPQSQHDGLRDEQYDPDLHFPSSMWLQCKREFNIVAPQET